MIRGRSTCWRCLSSCSSTAYPAAVIGILSIVARSSPILGRKKLRSRGWFGPATATFFPNSCRCWAPGRSPVSGLAAEIALQRAHLEITRKLGLDPLGRGNGPRKSGVVRNFMQEGGPAQRPAVGERGRPLGGIEHQLDPAVGD